MYSDFPQFAKILGHEDATGSLYMGLEDALFLRVWPPVNDYGATMAFLIPSDFKRIVVQRAVSFFRLRTAAPLIHFSAIAVREISEDFESMKVSYADTAVRPYERFLRSIEAKRRFAGLINAPELIEVDPHDPPRWYRERFVPGRRCDCKDIENPSFLSSLAGQLHAIATLEERPKQARLVEFAAGMADTADLARWSLSFQETLKVCPVHGDVLPKNIIVTGAQADATAWLVDWDAYSENSVLFDPLYFLINTLDCLGAGNIDSNVDRFRTAMLLLFKPFLNDPGFGDIFAHRQSLMPYWQALLMHLWRMWGSSVVFDGYREFIDTHAEALSDFLVSQKRD